MPEDGPALRDIERTLGMKLERTRFEGFEIPDIEHPKPSVTAKPRPVHHRAVRGRPQGRGFFARRKHTI